jgi:hypothetical protein
LRLLSRLLTKRHQFFSNPVRDTHSRLICHPPFTESAVLDRFSSPLLATSGAHCRFTAAPAYISHRRPISLHHRNASAFPQSQPSSRFPSHLIIAYHPLHPPSQKPRCSSPFLSKSYFPISSRTDFVVSQLPLLQNIVQASWARFVHLLCNTFNPFAVSGLGALSLFFPKHYPLSHQPKLPLSLADGLPRATLRTPPA